MRLRKSYSHFPPNIGKLRRHLDSESGELFRNVDAEGPNLLGQTALESFARYGKHIVLPSVTCVINDAVKLCHPLVAELLPEHANR